MCYALATQRLAILPCREEGRDSKERGEDTSSPLSLAVQGGSEGLLTGQQSLRIIQLHFSKQIIKSEFYIKDKRLDRKTGNRQFSTKFEKTVDINFSV